MTALTARRISSSSVDFLTVQVDSTRGGEIPGVTLSAQAVAIALLPRGQDPDDATAWLGASWFGAAGAVRSAGILIGPGTSNVVPEGTYEVYVRVIDNPTSPVGQAGRLTVY
jgi:hypothetical protein